MLSTKKIHLGPHSKSAQGLVSVILSTIIVWSLTNFLQLPLSAAGALTMSTMLTGFTAYLIYFTIQHRPAKRTSLYLALLSLLASLSIVVGSKINGYVLVPIDPRWTDIPHILSWWAILFCTLHVSVFGLARLKYSSLPVNMTTAVSKKAWLMSSLLLFVAWVPYLLAFFPGILNSDTSDQLSQALGDKPIGNHHPAIVAGFMSIFAHLGIFISGGSYVAGIAFITVAQMIILSTAMGYTIAWLYTRFGLPLLHFGSLIFYALFPLVPYFAITVGKDALFATSVLILTVLFFDLVLSKGELLRKRSWIVMFLIAALSVMLTRNNGVYIILLSALFVLTSYRSSWKRISVIFSSALIAYFLIVGPLFFVMKISLSSSAESFGVLLQQVGRTVASDGRLSNDDRATLEKLLPIERWKNYYSPSTPDRLKFCYTPLDACMDRERLDEIKTEFLATWLSIGLKNPKTYIDAFLTQNSSFWFIGSFDYYGEFSSYEHRYTHGSFDIIDKATGHSPSQFIESSILGIRNSPLGIIANQAALIWLTLFSITLMLIYRKYQEILIVLPVFSLWISLMLAAPAITFRYSLATFLAIPLIVAVIVRYGAYGKKPRR